VHHRRHRRARALATSGSAPVRSAPGRGRAAGYWPDPAAGPPATARHPGTPPRGRRRTRWHRPAGRPRPVAHQLTPVPQHGIRGNEIIAAQREDFPVRVLQQREPERERVRAGQVRDRRPGRTGLDQVRRGTRGRARRGDRHVERLRRARRHLRRVDVQRVPAGPGRLGHARPQVMPFGDTRDQVSEQARSRPVRVSHPDAQLAGPGRPDRRDPCGTGLWKLEHDPQAMAAAS